MQLPQELQTALLAEVSSLDHRSLARAAADLSKRYRSKSLPARGRRVRSPVDIVAYVAFRLPATFGAVYASLKQVQEVLPSWDPVSLVDVGAGPGTVMWAATAIWPDLRHITLLEREEGMIATGKRLADHSSLASIHEAKWVMVDLTSQWQAPQDDLTTAAYILGELPEAHRGALVSKLWGMTSGVLVLVEPGTPEGFSRIREARKQLTVAGAELVAPCPHHEPCPVAGSDWCHFSQRIARSRLHRQVKDGRLSYEDEKFSFVAASRTPAEMSVEGRIIRHPQIRKGHIRLESCTTDGLTSEVVTRRKRELWRKARHLQWGSVWPPSR